MMSKISTIIKGNGIFLLFLLCMIPTMAFAEEKTCPNYLQFQEEIATFWPGQVFDIMKQVFCDITFVSWNRFAKPLQGVIAVGVGIYIAVYTLKMMSSFSQQDVAAYFSNNKTGLLILMAKVAFIFMLLGDEKFVYKYLVSPFIEAGATIGDNGWGAGFGGINSVESLFDRVIGEIRKINGKVHEIIALGRLMLCMVTLPDTIIDWHFKVFPFGAMTYIFGQLIVIFLAFYMMDIIFRLGVGCVLLPFGIACGISKLTSHYTKQLWNLFINVAFNFIMIKIVIDFTTQMMEHALMYLLAAKIKAILAARVLINDADVEEFIRSLSLASFVLVSLACMIAIRLFLDVETIAEKMSNTSGIGKMAQKLAGDATKFGMDHGGKFMLKQPGLMAGTAAEEFGSTMMNTKAGKYASRKFHSGRDRLFRGREWVKRNVFGIDDATHTDRWGSWIKKQAKRILRI